LPGSSTSKKLGTHGKTKSKSANGQNAVYKIGKSKEDFSNDSTTDGSDSDVSIRAVAKVDHVQGIASMRDNLIQLSLIGSSRIFSVRNIQTLGLNSPQILKAYFSKFGPVEGVFVTHSTRRQKASEEARGGSTRKPCLRPAVVGFVAMEKAQDAIAVMQTDREHVIRGYSVLVSEYKDRLPEDSESKVSADATPEGPIGQAPGLDTPPRVGAPPGLEMFQEQDCPAHDQKQVPRARHLMAIMTDKSKADKSKAVPVCGGKALGPVKIDEEGHVEGSLRSNLTKLSRIDSSRIVMVRNIGKLGLSSAQILKVYFQKFGRVEDILVNHNVVKPQYSHQKPYTRPACSGFVIMEKVQDASALLEEQKYDIQGHSILACKYEHRGQKQSEAGEADTGDSRSK
jgi:hypothetical protein